MHNTESKFVTGLENVLFAGMCVHFSACKFGRLGSEGAKLKGLSTLDGATGCGGGGQAGLACAGHNKKIKFHKPFCQVTKGLQSY